MHMLRLIAEGADPQIRKVISLGLQHEQQHQELLITDTKYIFAQNPLLPVWDEHAGLAHLSQPDTFDWLPVEEGIYEIGFEGAGFCFDNERERHRQFIDSFSVMGREVTTGEFLAFIEDGGYDNFRHWLSEGWEWVKQCKVAHPLYWFQRNGEWYFYHIDGQKKLDRTLPLMHVSYFEADAFARWSGCRLPTEFEWETAARRYPSAFRNHVWEWTQSAYLPYKGFTTEEGAIGEYNGKFMVNQMVLRGGSIATPPGHSRVSYRNFFKPHMQWQFSGIRLAQDIRSL